MPASTSPRRHSIASSSSAASLADEHMYAASAPHRDADTGYAYDGAPKYDASTPPLDTDAPPTSSPPSQAPSGFHQNAREGVPGEQQESARPANRSRARAFSFLSVHAPAAASANPGIPSPAHAFSADAPFAGGTYESAFDDDAEDNDADFDSDADEHMLASSGSYGGQSIAMNRLGHGVSSPGDKAVYRVRFQPLDSLELAWMALSAFLVVGLTVGSLIVAFVG
ncbi:hypothetical protein JCM3774_005359 [Rhodotorula dairenensis]